MAIGIIGGSGFYEWLGESAETKETPFGISSPITTNKEEGSQIYFLARHGPNHSLPPHLVNYRANIYALRELGVSHIVTTNAVGSCVREIEPGDFLIPDQLIDLVTARESTFFTGKYRNNLPEEFQEVKHTDVSYPYKGVVRQTLLEVLSNTDFTFHPSGTYVTTQGPRFETAAEIQMIMMLGGSVVGMTSAPEAFLARELGMDYATTCLVTNYGAGIQDKISHAEVIDLFESRIDDMKQIIRMFLDRIRCKL